MPNIIRNVKLNRVDLVDAPASPSARVVLVKRDDDDAEKKRKEQQKAAPGIGAVHVPVPDKRSTYMKKEETTLLKRLTALLKDFGGAGTASHSFVPSGGGGDDHMTKLTALHGEMAKALEGLPPEHPMHAVHKALGDQLAGMRPVAKEDDPIAMAAAGMSDEDVKKFEAMIEKRDETFAKSLKEANDRATAAETLAKSLSASAGLAEVKVDLAKFAHCSIDIEKEAPIMKSLKDVSPEAYASVLAKFAAAEAIAAQNDLIKKQLGSPLPGSAAAAGSAWAEIETLALGIIAKDTTGLTKAAAINRVMEDPKNYPLVKRYVDEGGANDPRIV